MVDRRETHDIVILYVVYLTAKLEELREKVVTLPAIELIEVAHRITIVIRLYSIQNSEV